MSRFNHLNPRKLLVRTRFNYEKLPGGGDSQGASPLFSHPYIKSFKHRNPWANRIQRPRLSFARVLTLLFVAVLFSCMIGAGAYKRHINNRDRNKGVEKKLYHWEHYPR
jgi:hypothetical protein